MPLHMSSLVSRHTLLHPDEKPPAPTAPLDYERVLKFNPNHDTSTGRFTSGSGGGGRRGGTVGAPTEDAFGKAFGALATHRKMLANPGGYPTKAPETIIKPPPSIVLPRVGDVPGTNSA